MKINKKSIVAAALAVLMASETAYAVHIPDHRGTDISAFSNGTKTLSSRIPQYDELFKAYGDQYGIDPNILAAICMQESSGINYSYRDDGTPYAAWGIMQIEYTHEKSFSQFGYDNYGTYWTLEDRLDPGKSIAYAAYLLSESLYKYECDYAKMLQAYNFGETVLNRIVDAKGADWLSERKNAVKYVTGWDSDSYGDGEYIEHVLAYYYPGRIEYVGAKVRMDGKLVKFSEQYPIIDDGTTLIPIRKISESLGAVVDWDAANLHASIKKDDRTIDLYIGSTAAYINGTEYTLEVPAKEINNRTLVPLRFVAEALGVKVDWDGDTMTVNLTTDAT